jgi:hypothetical protein
MADNVTNPSNSYISHYSELEIPRTVPLGQSGGVCYYDET